MGRIGRREGRGRKGSGLVRARKEEGEETGLEGRRGEGRKKLIGREADG